MGGYFTLCWLIRALSLKKSETGIQILKIVFRRICGSLCLPPLFSVACLYFCLSSCVYVCVCVCFNWVSFWRIRVTFYSFTIMDLENLYWWRNIFSNIPHYLSCEMPWPSGQTKWYKETVWLHHEYFSWISILAKFRTLCSGLAAEANWLSERWPPRWPKLQFKNCDFSLIWPVRFYADCNFEVGR